MSQRIRRFTVMQTAKLFATLYTLMGLVFLPFLWLSSRAAGTTAGAMGGFPVSGRMLLLLPVLYGALGFVFVALGCAIYNLVAGWVGGIEVEFEPTTDGAAR